MGIFTRISNLTKLAELYPALHDPEGLSHTNQTVQFGVVRYRRCVTVNISSDGFFLWAHPPLCKQAKLLIPWDEIKQVRAARLYGRQGVYLSIGDPEIGDITVYRNLFELVRAHLIEPVHVGEE